MAFVVGCWEGDIVVLVVVEDGLESFCDVERVVAVSEVFGGRVFSTLRSRFGVGSICHVVLLHLSVSPEILVTKFAKYWII